MTTICTDFAGCPTAHKKGKSTRPPKVFTWNEIPSGHSNKAVGGFLWIREHRHDNLDRGGCCCCCCGYFTRIFVWSECVSLRCNCDKVATCPAWNPASGLYTLLRSTSYSLSAAGSNIMTLHSTCTLTQLSCGTSSCLFGKTGHTQRKTQN